ncbi:hypothetical protein QR98_0058860 [Sarcoptes scabiei]|uniref:Uncharacterized protein n=1 Tax=Sarcoptes scabiei TaxID=52283 RepID=A0A132A8U4_SARSC|nr:hypothetical protein QR98_0058860 [Sarcoptes scabiei]
MDNGSGKSNSLKGKFIKLTNGCSSPNSQQSNRFNNQIDNRYAIDLIGDTNEDVFDDSCMEIDDSSPLLFYGPLISINHSPEETETASQRLSSKLVHQDFFNDFEDLFDNITESML